MDMWSLKGKNVLIVDDFHEMRLMLRDILSPLYPDKIVTAVNGREAIEALEKIQFIIVLCDYNLGEGKDGQQVLEEARKRTLLPFSAVFMMITAENTSDMVMGAIEHLPDDYIAKPFTKSQVHSRVKRQLEKKEGLLKVSEAVATKNYAHAITLCDEQLAQNPPNRIELIKAKGEFLIMLGQYQDAAQLYEDILEERDIPWALLALGKARYELGQYGEAEHIFESLIDDNPANILAYDLLARTLEKTGDLDGAQTILTEAAEKSPKSLFRQRQLAEIAFKNKDYEASETAYKNAVQVGQHSCFKEPEDFTGLAKSMIKQDTPKEALAVIETMKGEFAKADMTASIQTSTMEGMIHKELGNDAASAKAVENAMELFSKHPERMPSDTAMDLADACLAVGKDDDAGKLAKHVVRNNHENEEMLDRTRDVFKNAGKGDDIDQLIDAAREEVVQINNEGVDLAKTGKLEESIELFIRAAKGMPENPVINLNAAHSMIMKMQKSGQTRRYLTRAMDYLERVREVDPTNKRYHKLVAMTQKITG